MKAGFKHYYEPTPKNLRKLGDALFGAAAFVTGPAIVGNYHVIAIAALVVGFAGKFLTNFFTEDKT